MTACHYMKIAPKLSPNDNGEWREIPPQNIRGGWSAVESALSRFVPEGYFLCGYSSNPPAPAEGVSASQTLNDERT